MARNTLIIITGSNAIFNFKKAYFNIPEEEAVARFREQHVLPNYPDVQVIEFEDVLTLSTSPDGIISIDIDESAGNDTDLAVPDL